MDNKNIKITWWHLLGAGMGIYFLNNLHHSILIDVLIATGTGWGILLLIKYIYNKVVKKVSKK